MDICVYHGNCADGFGAAYAVWKKFGDTCIYHKGRYGEDPPNVGGLEVVLVDFSYKREVLLEMAKTAKSILILDHHKTAEADLVNLPDNVTVEFDMDRSGAVITWQYFHPDKPIPQLLLHVQDRDLWRFELEGTREIQANVFSHEYDFNVWEELMNADPQDLAAEGKTIERKQAKDINEFIKAASYRTMIAGHEVPVLNAPYFWSSDAGHIMGKGELFAACYWDTPDGRVFSLRSAEEGMDVSEIASSFGGGGHKHAAGFKVSYKEPIDLLEGK